MRQSDSDASSDDDVLLQPLTPLCPTQPLSDPAQSTARLLTPVGPPHPFQTLLSVHFKWLGPPSVAPSSHTKSSLFQYL